MSTSKLDRNRAALVVVDVQEAFRKAIPGFANVAAASAKLVEGASAMGIPVVITEQYPKGLGEIVSEVSEHLPEG
ncbi:MAG: isochorismatase family protein, partial [Solirubrobacterales bacterium]